MQMPFLRHSELASTTIWLRMYWHTGAQEVKVHFSCAPLGNTCTKIGGASRLCSKRHRAGLDGSHRQHPRLRKAQHRPWPLHDIAFGHVNA